MNDTIDLRRGVQIGPGKYELRNGGFALIISSKTMNAGRVTFWHGQVLKRFTDRHGVQGAWDQEGKDLSGNTALDLVAPALSASDLVEYGATHRGIDFR